MQDTKKTNTDKTTIGLLIKAKLRERKQSVVWLAGQLGCSRTNVYKIFGKKSIDTDELMKISRILNFDFFKLYSRPLKSPFWGDVVLTQYLANFLKHATKSFHGSFEVIDRSHQKNVHSISRHTLIKVAA